MRIRDVRTVPVGLKLDEPLRWGKFTVSIKGGILVFVDTDEGITGIGEAGSTVHYYPIVQPIIEHILKPLLVGEDPTDIGRLWEKMFLATHKVGRRGLETFAISGVDIALWDLLGKVCGKPVYKLLGAVQRRVEAYWAPSLKGVDVVARECGEAVDMGFRAIKLRVGMGCSTDVEIVRVARKVVGDDIVLMVDPNMAYDLPTAVEMARRFAEFGVFWLEEPILALDASAYVEEHLSLKIATGVRLAGGETMSTKHDFAHLVRARAFDVLQPDATMVGGISECRKVGVMAEAAGLTCIPHIGCGSFAGVNLAANMQVICSLSNSPYVEFDAYGSPLRGNVLKDPLEMRDGYVEIPDAPGIGVHVDETALAEYIVSP